MGASGKYTHVHSPECKIRSHPIPAMQGLCPAIGRIRVPQIQLVKLGGWHGFPPGGCRMRIGHTFF